eukprot:11199628-Prorocentrum_lima.AAC.1
MPLNSTPPPHVHGNVRVAGGNAQRYALLAGLNLGDPLKPKSKVGQWLSLPETSVALGDGHRLAAICV